MFYKYEIKNNGIENILYLYLTMAYEFSKELSLKENDKEITRRTKNFIKNNGINYNGNKVYLVIDGIVVKSLDITSDEENIELLSNKLYYSNEHYFVSLKFENSVLIEISLKEYLLGLLATIYIPNMELETLKAICTLFRSFAFKEMSEKRLIMAVNEFCSFRPISYYKLIWIDNYDKIYNLILEAINSTDCIFTTYKHYYTLPFLHYCNDGKTLSSVNHEYLSSVSSLWDLAAPYYINIKDFSYLEISKLLHSEITNTSDIKIIDIDENGFINKIKIDNSFFTGDEFIKLLGLKSRLINIIINKNSIRFINKGWGYFYGMSIFGANEIAKNGCNYIGIIKYYFPLFTINKYIKELS